MRIRKLLMLALAAAIGFGGATVTANAGSNLCNANRVCIYVDHEWVGLLGMRSAGGGLVNVSSGANDRTSSWENRTSTNARWYFDASGKGACRDMIAKRELNITWYGGDNDKLTSWATNKAC